MKEKMPIEPVQSQRQYQRDAKSPAPKEAMLQASYQQQMDRGRRALLLLILLSLANILLMTVFSNRSFILTAALPQMALLLGHAFSAECGTNNTLVMGIIMAVIVVGLYSMCWFMAGKHKGWLVTAAGLMIFDALFLLTMTIIRFDKAFLSQYIIQMCFEGIMLFYLLRGASAFFRMRLLRRQADRLPLRAYEERGESSFPAN